MNYFYWLTHQFSPEGMLGYREWYGSLEKPFFAPSPETFGLAWGIIYPLIAIALLTTIYLRIRNRIPRGFALLFVLNIALNLTFTATALATRDNVLTSLHLILVLGTLSWLMVRSWRYSKVIFVLLLPYLLWGTFATILQLALTAMN